MFGYNDTYIVDVCPYYGLREQYGWDFVVCEAIMGWSAIHVTTPFWVYLFFGDFLSAWILAGLAECFEAAMILLFGGYIVFGTSELLLETHTGSLVGDWLINGTLGVLAAFLLADALRLPPLLPTFERALLRQHHWAGRGYADDEARRSSAFWRVRYEQWLLIALFVAATIVTDWVVPLGCTETDARTCHNVGLLTTTALHGVLAAIVALAQRSPYVWGRGKHAYSRRRRIRALALAYLFELTVHAQAAQPWVPLWLGPAGGFTQVWLVTGIWIAVLGIVYLWHWRGSVAMRLTEVCCCCWWTRREW